MYISVIISVDLYFGCVWNLDMALDARASGSQQQQQAGPARPKTAAMDDINAFFAANDVGSDFLPIWKSIYDIYSVTLLAYKWFVDYLKNYKVTLTCITQPFVNFDWGRIVKKNELIDVISDPPHSY